ncbi:hypothetical protein FIBSPDRAFT_889818 [Athelia psychrophila]|uniref:Uncharacterized protein n=1 Tax=Athelia psychrophila TaxID=1759441 RepID=A0A166LPG8_9AGAM|nr:hypothetical protein FIBSPDRAFT_889818 [Fibularhizoctonia sp. CBS 109695]
MKRAALLPYRVKLLCDGHFCYRLRRTNDPGRKSVRGCTVDTVIGIVKQGATDVPGLMNNILHQGLGPKPATKIRRNVVRREVTSAKKTDAKPYTKAPEIQTLVTPIRLHRRGHLQRIEHQKKQQTEYDVIIAKRMSEKTARVAAVKAAQTWKGMEALVKQGKEKFLEEILPTAEITLTVNQLELHLYTPMLNLLAYLKSEAIVDTATAITRKHRLQTSDVPTCSPLIYDVVVLPKLMTPARIASNCVGIVAAVKRLAEEDLQTLDGATMGEKQKRLTVPDCGIDFGFKHRPGSATQ